MINARLFTRSKPSPTNTVLVRSKDVDNPQPRRIAKFINIIGFLPPPLSGLVMPKCDINNHAIVPKPRALQNTKRVYFF